MLVEGADSEVVREPAVAGAFYPDSAVLLQRTVTELLENANPPKVPGEVVGLACPHAGYQYSGFVAAHGYKTIQGRSYDVAVILAPSHQEYFRGASVFPGRGYATPLGIAEVDRELAHRLAHASENAQLSWFGHRSEHSLEVQLPFLQVVQPDLKIVPVVIGEYDREFCEEFGQALAQVLSGRKALLVASTDLYHGYSYDDCVAIDDATLGRVLDWDAAGLCEGLESGRYQACGGGPLVVTMVAARELGANRVHIVARTNSADVVGERGGWTVGYAAIVFSAVQGMS
ncbi:MAG: AmmeMemoRadiSam system protein B [candidate division KSB1 bacterium]|nr:AmmeMemoRadiSam system protein B [candidate division KSB1 bacterium]